MDRKVLAIQCVALDSVAQKNCIEHYKLAEKTVFVSQLAVVKQDTPSERFLSSLLNEAKSLMVELS